MDTLGLTLAQIKVQRAHYQHTSSIYKCVYILIILY